MKAVSSLHWSSHEISDSTEWSIFGFEKMMDYKYYYPMDNHDEVISRLKTKKPHDVIIKLSLYTFDYQNMQKAARMRNNITLTMIYIRCSRNIHLG